MDLIQLDIAALKTSDSQNNAYVLLLNELVGKRQLPIVIGWCEARSIALALEDADPPERPLTHDLFLSISDSFDITVSKVVIHTLNEGIFHASFFCKSAGKKEIEIDARTSDAVAIAVRFKCPIFTYEEVLSKAGIILDKTLEEDVPFGDENVDTPKEKQLKDFTLNKLKNMLKKAIEDEDYERASAIRDEINSRNDK
ncbi:MAG: bifunctional nuclease family protein [Bacteroidota bacterium]|nr:bifunctional nuclease family protein [Bacteroidota bacterium]